MAYEKKYAKGSGSRKTKPTKDGEVQTAGLGAVIAGAAALGTYGYLLHRQYEATQDLRALANEEKKKDLAKKKTKKK